MREIESIKNLIDSLKRLPGIGSKSAERMAYQILDMDKIKVDEFISSLKDVQTRISICPICGSYMEDGNCPFCNDSSRDKNTLVVVSFFKDALAFERLSSFHAYYHILGGTLSPTKGIGIDDLNFSSLLKRINEGSFKEIILATDPTIDGETTALYIAKILESKPIIVTRLAYGLPMGGHLDYADDLTLTRALEGRKRI